jgi:hypothetical protein
MHAIRLVIDLLGKDVAFVIREYLLPERPMLNIDELKHTTNLAYNKSVFVKCIDPKDMKKAENAGKRIECVAMSWPKLLYVGGAAAAVEIAEQDDISPEYVDSVAILKARHPKLLNFCKQHHLILFTNIPASILDQLVSCPIKYQYDPSQN